MSRTLPRATSSRPGQLVVSIVVGRPNYCWKGCGRARGSEGSCRSLSFGTRLAVAGKGEGEQGRCQLLAQLKRGRRLGPAGRRSTCEPARWLRTGVWVQLQMVEVKVAGAGRASERQRRFGRRRLSRCLGLVGRLAAMTRRSRVAKVKAERGSDRTTWRRGKERVERGTRMCKACARQAGRGLSHRWKGHDRE